MPISPDSDTYLSTLESESIEILREVAATAEHPAILYSVGKDSSVLVHLASKAFYPGRVPFPLIHVDTGFKFPEMYTFRDEAAKRYGLELIVHRNEDAIARDTNPFKLGTKACCGLLKTKALLDVLAKYQIDAAIGGARRDEERSRAKERIFSFRDAHGQWDPKNQRPELWHLYNSSVRPGEHMRVFPLSNWTEFDIWNYIRREAIPIVPLYYAVPRPVIVRGTQLIPVDAHSPLSTSESVKTVMCRFRTLGCSPCTGAVASEATDIEQIIAELFASRVSERSTRIIDHDQDASMELKKREGYF
ncbi:MAG: sulfate adenylyltransferase subunit CysD [Deltaproteobacteria bacterium]|nr:sulfate adenylyltransferase subunit CysD [Deltaproteobacteria bacterium]